MTIHVVKGGVRGAVVEGGLPLRARSLDKVLVEIRVADGGYGSRIPQCVGGERRAEGANGGSSSELRAALGEHRKGALRRSG